MDFDYIYPCALLQLPKISFPPSSAPSLSSSSSFSSNPEST